MKAHTPRLHIALVASLALFVMAGAATAAGPAPAAQPVVRPTQELVTLLGRHEAFLKPDRRSVRVGLVQARRPITGAQTVLPVVGHATDPAGVAWVRVRLPGRPNGFAGWIEKRATRASATGWHIVVNVSSRRVVVYHGGRVVRAFPAVVGKPSTPTPRGPYFVEEAVDLPATAVGAPFALALSARSYVLQEFAGGPGQIAIHGLENIGGVLGTAASHGCVRVDTVAIRWLVARMGPGTPVTVRG